ncbi:MAG: dicarboxylate/amino acid:cation symporter [Vicinamibacteria bacterium]|nr:dicarboxylate/amino acid:cation symporter [Vicinamibacteria bacterium]
MKISLTGAIVLAMVVGGLIGFGIAEGAVSKETAAALLTTFDVLSKIFLKLIKTIVSPLIFSTLVVGIAGHSNLKQVGRMGLKALIYFEVVTTLALFIGLGAINFTRAGVGVSKPDAAETLSKPPAQNAADIVLHVFPDNIAKSVAEGQVLQVVIFSLLFGMGLAMVEDKHKQKLLPAIEAFAETMFKFTKIVMYYAPVAVGAAMAYTIGKMGIDVLGNLAKLVLTLYGALIVFVVFVLVPVALIFRIHIKRFVAAVSEPASLAFATSASEAALPLAMERMEKFGVPRQVVSFVIPTGYSFNLDGSTLYLALASIFVAQAANVDLPLSTQIIMMVTLMLTSKGVAGVPRATLVIILGTCAQFGLPEWPVAVILGVDAIMDMARTAVNVTGNCLASAVVARWEGVLNDNPDASEPAAG